MGADVPVVGLVETDGVDSRSCPGTVCWRKAGRIADPDVEVEARVRHSLRARQLGWPACRTAPARGMVRATQPNRCAVEEAEEFDLREYARVLRRRAWVILLSIIVVGGLAAGLSLMQTKVYSASAEVLIPQQNAISQLNDNSSNAQPNPQYLQRNIDNAQKFAQSDVVKNRAAKDLGFRPSVKVSSSSDVDVLTFHASSPDPSRAAKVANAYAKAYIDASRQQQIDNDEALGRGLSERIGALQQQQAKLPPGSSQAATIAAQIASLQQQQSTLQAASQLSSSGGGEVINAANVPNIPSSPKVIRNGLLGVAVGLLLGIGLAFLLDRLDDSIKSKHDIEAASAPVPLLGLIPEVGGWRNKTETHVITLESPQSIPAESYRTLRTSVQFLGLERQLRIVGITSPNAGEGKTATLANLAVSAATSGLRVVMVSCDLRRPRLRHFFGVPNDVGFSSVLLGEASLDEALQPIEGQPRMRILTSGPVPPNPAELLALSRAGQVVQSLARVADLVLVDCPPLLPVTDPLLISRYVDGMLVVSRARRTNKRDLHRGLELLGQVDAPVIGTILNAVPAKGGYGYSYGYGYGSTSYAYSYAPNGKAREAAEAAEANGDRRRWGSRRRAAADEVEEEVPG